MAELQIDATVLLEKTLDAAGKVGVHEGGSSSSKTVSLAQAHLIWSFQEPERIFSVVRGTMPALKRGALRDWQNVLRWADVEHKFSLNKTDHVYTNLQTGTQIEFMALDHEQKARGPRRDRLWINEANEVTFENYRQLSMRTRSQIWLDYNPSMQRSWIYDHVLTREDCTHIHSTYKDNRFLTEEQIREIEVLVPVYEEADGSRTVDWNLTYTGTGRLILGDPYQWSVFGLGLRGAPSEAIYPYVYEAPFPEGVESILCLDFGFTHPMVLLRLARIDQMGRMPDLHVDELVHTSSITTDDLIEMMPEKGVEKQELIYADSARPDEILKLQRAGYNVVPAHKGPGSVYSGIIFVKQHRLLFTARSTRSKAQFQDYRWKKLADGTIIDEPVKLDDDAPDAARYGATSHWDKGIIDYSRI